MKKKLLSIILTVAMLATMCANILIPSATDAGTLTVGTTTITQGTTVAVVDVTVDLPADVYGPHEMFTLSVPDGFAVTGVELTDVAYIQGNSATCNGTIKIEGTNAGTVLLESSSVDATDTHCPVVDSFVVKVTYSVPAETAAGTYAITATNEIVDANNEDVELAISTGAIVVVEPHTCSAGTATPNNDGTHDIACADTTCELLYADNETCTYVDGICSVCKYAEPVNKPIEITTGKYINPSLYLDASVASDIAINIGGIKNLGYSSYYVEITYSYYKTGYIKDTTTVTYYPEDAYRQNSSGTADYILFDKLALYEMPLDYTVKVCMLDAEGNYVAYNTVTTSVQKLALSYAQKYSTDTLLLTALVDMVNYGAAAQEYFAAGNQGSDIDGAVLPNVGFEDYQKYASDATDLPESFNVTNTTKTPTISSSFADTSTIKNVAGVLIGASTSIEFKFQAKSANGYDASKLTAVITYTNAYGTEVKETVPFTSMDNSTTDVYVHVFKKLALYDLESTVHVSILNGGIEELCFDYSVGYFVNQYISNASLTDVLTAMELFAQSARIKLVGA